MTGTVALDLLIAAIAIAALTGLVRFLFGADEVKLDQAGAAARLAFDEPDFAPREWLVDASGRAALAVNAAGEIAIVQAMARGAATRRAPKGRLKASCNGEEISVRATDLGFNETTLTAPSAADALQWALRINDGDAI